ncbi:MAG: hypothetical protein EBU66_09185 [Bacteroidetes bacterium]|nr:hypothetical protein [bacterium]NBP64815.1 hypothetical protein [Bacteroidota bacterium]
MNSKLVLAVVVILLLLYVIFKALTTNYTTLGTMQKWTNKTTLQGSNLPNSFKANSAVSIWFYIKKWVNGAKIISFHSNATGTPTNAIFQAQFKNNTNTIQIFPRSGSDDTDTCAIADFPLQKWVNLIVSFNGSAMDVYVDGKLVKSCVVNMGSKLNETQAIMLGDEGPLPNDVGFITNVKLKAAPIAPQEAWDIYSQGFGGSPWSDLLNKYKVKLSFIVDNQEQASVST